MSAEIIYAIGLARVSAAKQAVQGDSLALQADQIRAYVERNGWTLFPDNHVFLEPFTGTTDVRPDYTEILRLLRKHPGKVRYLVVKVIDRFSREGSLRYQQMKNDLAALRVELRDVGGVIQPTVNTLEHTGFSYKWSRKSPSALSEIVLAETANHEISTILTRMIGAEILLVQAGYHVGPADDGYVVKRIFVDGKKRCAQFPDEKRAHFFREMFRLRAEGPYSEKEIVTRINALGYAGRPTNRWNERKTEVIGRRMGRPLTVKHLQEIIRRPVYCGIVRKKWTRMMPVRAKGGEPLISIDLFNRANRGAVLIKESLDGALAILYNQRPERLVIRRPKFRTDFPYKNIVRCGTCGRPMHASFSRGRSGAYFGAYHCTRGHKRYAVPQPTLDDAFTHYISTVRFKETLFDAFEAAIRVKYRAEDKTRASLASEAGRKLAELQATKTLIADAFTSASTVTMRTELERKLEGIEKQINEFGSEQRANDVTDSDLEDFIASSKKVLEHPGIILETVGNEKEQRALYDLFFEEIPTYDEIAFGTPKLGLAFTLSCDRGAVESELVRHHDLSWNHFATEIQKWQRSAWAIDAVLRRIEGHDALAA